MSELPASVPALASDFTDVSCILITMIFFLLLQTHQHADSASTVHQVRSRSRTTRPCFKFHKQTPGHTQNCLHTTQLQHDMG
jgi:hypothetical protein